MVTFYGFSCRHFLGTPGPLKSPWNSWCPEIRKLHDFHDILSTCLRPSCHRAVPAYPGTCFGCPRSSPWDLLGSPWAPLGPSGAPPQALLGPSWAPLALPLDLSWVRLGSFGTLLGLPWTSLGHPLGPQCPPSEFWTLKCS